MTQLTLILRDFYPPEEAPADADARFERYPQLEAALRYASRSQHDDWRQWLVAQTRVWGVAHGAVARSAVSQGGAVAEGAIAALLRPETAAAPLAWLATPVHFVAGLDTVRVHPAGILQLTDPEQQQLAADFARVFAGSGLTLWALGERELLLTAPRSLATAGTSDPARYLGRVPTDGMPAGAGAAPLRRLGAELEMWLHEHAVNRQRVADGKLPVSALWLWGGGQPVVLAPRNLPRLVGHELFTRGLWSAGHAVPEELPDGFAALGELQQDCIALLPTLGKSGRLELGALETSWFAPALAALDKGRLRSLRIVVGRQHFALGRGRRWRRWRTLRPWWEQLR